MKTKRELAQEQLNLMDEIRAKANINIVTCGNCGTVLMHEMKQLNEENTITCYDCKSEMDLSDCPDLWYDNVLNNAEFDEEEVITTKIDTADVIAVADRLYLNPSIGVINNVLKHYDSEERNDPTATWDLIVENLLFTFLED